MSDLDSMDSVLGDDDGALVGDLLPPEDPNDDAPGDETDTDPTPGPDAQPTEPPAPPAGKSDELVPKAAVLDERRKRQELERKISQLEAQQNPATAAPEPKARPDVFENQDAAFAHIEERFEQRLLSQRIETSREDMQERHADYDEKELMFVELAQADPSLVAKMQAAARPAKFVYDHVVKHLQMQEMQDPDAYKAKLKEELRAELLAELESERSAADDAEATGKTPPPPQLVNRRSAERNPAKQETLEEILGG